MPKMVSDFRTLPMFHGFHDTRLARTRGAIQQPVFHGQRISRERLVLWNATTLRYDAEESWFNIRTNPEREQSSQKGW